MKYEISKINGDAGEHFFAYWIIRHFNWPCRLLDIDLGIDAQLEVCNDDGIAKGEFIAVQIKATQDSNPNPSLELKNLEYWKTMEEPVVVVSIIEINRSPKMYWKIVNTKSINNLIEIAKDHKSKTTVLKFSIDDRLKVSSKNDFILLHSIKNIEDFEELCNKLLESIVSITSLYFDGTNDEYNFDKYVPDDDIVDHYSDFCKCFDDIKGYEYYDEITGSLYERLVVYPELEKHMEIIRALTSEYMAAQKRNNILDLIDRWKKHPYHSDISEIIDSPVHI